MRQSVKKKEKENAVPQKWANVLLFIATISMNLFTIMFVYRLYKKTPNFTSAYFRLLIIESFVNGFLCYNYFLLTFALPNSILMGGIFGFWSLFGQWYQYRFYGFCNLLLVLNRFTGVFFWKQHSRIWDGKPFYFAIFLLFGYPFILSGYDLRNAWTCVDAMFYNTPMTALPNYMTCISTFHNIHGVPVQVTISNAINAVLALSLGIATALARHIKGNKWQTKQKYENRLLMQSIFISVLILLFEVFTVLHGIMAANYTATVNTVPQTQSEQNWLSIYECLVFCTRTLFSCSSGIILFIMSYVSFVNFFAREMNELFFREGVRNSFISFYYLYRLPLIKNSANCVTIITISKK